MSTAEDDHLHWNDLPRERKFNLLVDDVTAKGPFVISVSLGYLLLLISKLIVVPAEKDVSGIIRFIKIMLSPFASPLKYPVSKEDAKADDSSLTPFSWLKAFPVELLAIGNVKIPESCHAVLSKFPIDHVLSM